jgi:hypothetical protein
VIKKYKNIEETQTIGILSKPINTKDATLNHTEKQIGQVTNLVQKPFGDFILKY